MATPAQVSLVLMTLVVLLYNYSYITVTQYLLNVHR